MQRFTIAMVLGGALLAGCPKSEEKNDDTSKPEPKAKAPVEKPQEKPEEKPEEKPADSPATAPAPAIGELAYVGASGEDRVGKTPAFQKDGAADHHFRAVVSGDVHALVLTVCTGGKHTISQWDTLAAGDAAPAGFHWRDGGATWALAVVDSQGQSLNQADGRLSRTTFAAGTKLDLLAADSGTLLPKSQLCLTALGAKGDEVARAEMTLP